MAVSEVRKVIRLGGSLAITLPPKWAADNLKPGQEVVLIGLDKELRVIVIEPGQEGDENGSK